MRRNYGRVVCVVALLFTLLALVPTGAAGAREAQPSLGLDRWIVGLRVGAGIAASQGTLAPDTGDAALSAISKRQSEFLMRFTGTTSASDAVARLLRNPAVAYVEPDILYRWQYTPSDPLFPEQQWAQIDRLPDAWSIATGKPSTVVAELDSGVRPDHPDLKGKLVPGYDFFNNDADPTDDVGHGTAVAGILAARGDDGIGIAGTAMNVDIMPIKVGNGDGAPVSVIAKGVYYAVDHGATVLNLSLGSDTPSATLENAIQYAYDHNVVVVAAAGNAPDHASFPASYRQTISVAAATAGGDNVAEFSSRISRVDLSAPGVNILTSYWDSNSGNAWAVVSGTSFATPMIAGTVALMRSVNPDLTVEQVRAILTGTARSTLQSAQGGGAGLVDAGAAVRGALLPSFANTWQPLDRPVAAQATHRTWVWGPNAFAVGTEPYAQAQQGERLVAYFDKSRMEITDPYADRNNVWYVTNGLLVTEMVKGRVQVGDDQFAQKAPAQVPVAGDPDDTTGPTYASFSGVTGANPLAEGSVITQTIDRNGKVGSDARFQTYGVTATDYIQETKHRVASVFRDYLSSLGVTYADGQFKDGQKLFDPTYYATGYPITEAYWASVKVAGKTQHVLVQCFERRCLTYTPGNPDGWKVEMGNVGQHYYRWRYGDLPTGPAADDPTALAR